MDKANAGAVALSQDNTSREEEAGLPPAPALRSSAWFNNIEKPILFIGLILMILIINYQSLFRYSVSSISRALDDPFWGQVWGRFVDIDSFSRFIQNISGAAVWSEELSRYIFIWISYLAVPVAILTRSNIRVDVVFNKLSPRLQHIVWVMTDAFALILVGLIAYMGIEHVSMQIAMPQTTPAMRIAYFIPYLILPVGFSLMAIRTLQDIRREVRQMSAIDVVYSIAAALAVFLPVLVYDEWSPSGLLFTYFVVFLVLGVPIAFALGLATVATIIGAGTLPIAYLSQIAFVSIDSFPIMAIPFFIAAGVFMGAGGLSKRLLAVGDELVGALPGGMALASIMTCMFFAAISGSGPATVAAIGTITIPAMIARGYDKFFAAAVVAAAGAIGVIIPPSNPFVIYGVAGQVSVGKLFMAGIVPGLIMGLSLMAVTYIISKKKGWQGEKRARSAATLLHACWDAKWALLVPVIVLGGIYGGIMTPTEAAAVAALYGLIVGLWVYREMSWKGLYASCIETTLTSSIVIVLMAMATMFGNIMTIEQIPETIANAILSVSENKIVILLLINVFLLWVGIFMEALAAIVILTPILLPLALKLGVDPVHFGVIMVMNLAIGFITPPVGVNLFVASGIARTGIGKVAAAALPFLLSMLIVLMLVTYIPEISLSIGQ